MTNSSVEINQPKRILFFITDLDIGGAEKVVLNLCARLPLEQFQPVVAYLRGDAPLRKYFENEDIPVLKIHSFFGLIKLIKQKKIDLVHTHLIRGDFWGIPAARICGIPVITTKHNTNYFYGKSGIFILLDALINWCANRVICVSSAVKKWYQRTERIPENKLRVIYNGIDLEQYEKMPSDQTGHGKIILTVANFTHQKGYDLLLKAAQDIVKDDPSVQFIWVGGGPLYLEFQSQIRADNMQEHIRLTGCVDDVRPFLNQASVFVLASRWEGFGIVLLEAMAMRLPIVATRVDGIVEILAQESHAILVSPESAHALSQGIRQALGRSSDAPCRYASLGKYHIDKVLENYIREYKRCLRL